jgi:hypothetical protein
MSAALPFTAPIQLVHIGHGRSRCGPVHPKIGDKHIIVADQVDQVELAAVRLLEAVILGDDRPWGQCAALFGKPRHVAAEFNLFIEQSVARLQYASL